MKILLASMELKSLTGQPMYTYNLAKGLIEKGHEVDCVGLDTGAPIENMLEELGADVFNYVQFKTFGGHYDLAIISEDIPQYLKCFTADKIYNLCHSMNECDRPIKDGITGYITPRTQISDHWGIEAEIVPIPIDTDKFKVKREKQDKYIILAPCSREELRKPMLLNLISRANKDTEVWLVGEGTLKEAENVDNVKLFPPTTDIIDFMKKADEVAGIFIGTVTLEAWAMGIKTSVYDEKGNWEYVEPQKVYDYKEITNKILNL